MKTNWQSFETATASDSNDLIELDEASLHKVGGGVIHEPFIVTKKLDLSSAS